MIPEIRRVLKILCVVLLCMCFVGGEIALAQDVQASSPLLSAASKPKTYYVEGAMSLPYTDKFEFLKSAVRKPFKAVDTGFIMVKFTDVRNTEESRSKLHVRVYYRSAKKANKWIKGSHEAFWINQDKQAYSVILNVPKGRPFYIKLYKTNNKTIPTKGRMKIIKLTE